jgi:methylated-DNA-protein-cysteine methyltransferase-like protein
MDFRTLVLEHVQAIPEGQVATYGQIALLAGSPRAARQVGMVLRGLKDADSVPWHRVVNSTGGISTYKIGYGELQRALLEAEGVLFNAEGRLDLRRYRWRP